MCVCVVGARFSSVIELLLMIRWIVGLIPNSTTPGITGHLCAFLSLG